MKTLLIMVLILLALVGVMSVVIYASNPKASPGVKTEGPAQFTPVTQVESDILVLIEDPSLLGLTAGAFNPRFEPLSTSEQDTLNASAQQNLELQNMTAGDADENARIGWGVGLVILLFLIGIPF